MADIVQPFFPRQSANCILTCPDPVPCSCAANQTCNRINRDCHTCSQNVCVAATDTSGSSGSGISKGALAGGIIGAIAFLAIVVFVFLRYRKKSLLRKALANGREVKKDIPASAETVLNRPDPTEKAPSVITSTTPVELDTQAQSSSLHSTVYNASQQPLLNPFDDTNSIQTAGTEGTNVIPIALVPTQSHRASLPTSGSQSLPSTNPSFPMRPARSPELNLNLDHVNVSHDSLRAANGSKSVRSGISGISSRQSYMSGASYSSDLLSEAPMIMTPVKGSIRQVVGVVKAEVINADSLGSGSSSDGLKPPAYVSKSISKSPLASTSFGPDDIVNETDENHDAVNPFGDERTASAPAHHEPADFDSNPDGLHLPSPEPNIDSRPASIATQAGSIVNISSATRVAVGSKSTGTPRRTTMGRLISPPANSITLQEQQQRALAHAHAQAQAQGLDTRRISGSSVFSAASTRADSILESFPFVPPSPISDRPIRSPPVSPLGQQSFVNPSSSPLHQQTFVVAPPSPLSHQSFSADPNPATPPLPNAEDSLDLPAPPDRRTLGLSNGSEFSTASSGLGSFPFQIESESVSDVGSQPPAFHGRQRASLDTLALTTALSSYPLGFDRGNAYPPTKANK